MKPKKILIVEDEKTSRDIIALSVGKKDHELIFAEDGDEAVRMALEHRPDLILMDVMIPRISGYEATRIIKSNEDLKDIPVLAVTARTADYDAAMAREAGCDDYITKPFRVAYLREKLEKYLVED
jgi:CheY-like chemotaxis protein